MKKIVKLFGVMTIAAALLISCKPSTDDTTKPSEEKPDSGTNSEAPATPGNPGNDATGGDDGAGGNGGGSSGGTGSEEKTPGLEYANVYIVAYGDKNSKQEGKKITLKTGGSYQNVVIALKEPTDFSKGVKVKISVKDFEPAKNEDGSIDPNGNYGFLFASEGVMGKDDYGNDAIVSKILSPGYLEITEEAKEVTFKIDDDKAWGAESAADKTKITHIKFQPQKTKGTYVIEYIEPVTE